MIIEEEIGNDPNLNKQLEDAQKLFRTIVNQDKPFPKCLKGHYKEDPAFKPILDNPSNFTNFEIKEGLIFFRSEGMTRLTIPDISINGQSVRENIIHQGHSILAHLGGHKMLTYLRSQVWWKTIIQDITDYCKSCPTCATSKSPTEKPQGLLKMMPVPSHPWQYIGIDFIGPLPESSNQNGSYDMICVIIDLLTAMVHLVPTQQTYKATDMAEVVFDSVFKLHRLPERIISDRDSLFTSHFWKKLHSLLNIELQLSSAFYPQTDGATECANQTMTQMLRQCVSPKQKDWVKKLPTIEFAMNPARSSTTRFTPFNLNYGRNPSPMIWKGEEIYPGVCQFAENMKDTIMCAHDVIIASRVQHIVIGHYFCLYFSSIFNPTSFHIPYPTPFFLMFISTMLTPLCPLCLLHSRTNDKNTIRLVRPDTEQLDYWATNIPKQSCCGSLSPGSCAGTSSAATERSHHSKFRTSQTRSMSRSASTT